MLRKYLIPLLMVLGYILAYTGTIFIIIGLLFIFADRELPEQIIGVVSLATVLCITFLYLRLGGKRFRDIGCSLDKGWHKELALGAFEGAAAVMTIFLLLLVSGSAKIRGLGTPSLGQLLIMLAEGFFLHLFSVAFTEELLTRGYVYHYLRRRFTAAGAILVTSVFFALMHILNPGVTPLALFNIFLAGVVLNLLLLRDGRLWSAVGFHFLWNFIMGTIFTSPVSGGVQDGIIMISLVGDELVTGGGLRYRRWSDMYRIAAADMRISDAQQRLQG